MGGGREGVFKGWDTMPCCTVSKISEEWQILNSVYLNSDSFNNMNHLTILTAVRKPGFLLLIPESTYLFNIPLYSPF